MVAHPVPLLLQHVRRLTVNAASDEQLLTDFLAQRNQEAFAALMARHGPMVLTVCRRVLHDPHAAEDVFQATFLVLADRAMAIRRPTSLASYLHGVAYRLAVRARRQRDRSRLLVQEVTTSEPIEALAWKEVLDILDQELSRLSDRLRAPLVLCYLEGRTQDEAARHLGWSLNTLRRRLAQGKRVLEARLRSRGVTLSAALATLLTTEAAVPGALRAATLAAVCAHGVGRSAVGTSLMAGSTGSFSLLLSVISNKANLFILAFLGVLASWGAWIMTPEPAPVQGLTSEEPRLEQVSGGASDDPLPARSVVRLGTSRYRHGSRIESLSVSQDGNLAIVASGSRSFWPARVFNLIDGRHLYSLPQGVEPHVEAVGLSADGKILATKDGKFINFWEATTGKALRKITYMGSEGGSRSVTDWLTFSPDGKLLAATFMGHAIQVVDVSTGKPVRTLEMGAAATACIFSPDGRWLAAAGYDRGPQGYYTCIWEMRTGKEIRRFVAGNHPGGNGAKRSLAFSPDGSQLASAGWGDARVRLMDMATGKEKVEFPKHGEEIHSLAFAPDGKTIAAAADKIVLYDPFTGKERLRIPQRARGLTYNGDGTILTGAVGGAIFRWDVATGQQRIPDSLQDTAVEQILITPDNRQLFTLDQAGNVSVWDPRGGKPSHHLTRGAVRGLALSPQGRYLAWDAKGWSGGSQILLYDRSTQKILDRFPNISEMLNIEAFSPDERTLITVDNTSAMVRLWDIATGKEQRSFPAISGQKRPVERSAALRLPYFTRRVALSPDGKTLGIGAMDMELPVSLWDMDTGKLGTQLEVYLDSVMRHAEKADPVDFLGFRGRILSGHVSSGNGLAFSMDGRFLATWSENPFGSSNTDHATIWDRETGRTITTLMAGKPLGVGSAAFAPDGKTLATASKDGTIRLWEIATWKVRSEFRGHRDRITALAFGPDGRLYSGGLDTVVLGWDTQPPREKQGTLAEAWETLAQSDATLGFQAQGRFLTEPEQTVSWLEMHLSPVRALSPARIKSLIKDLDSDLFATRERAKKELQEHRDLAASALREAAANDPSVETRRRAEELLQEIVLGLTPPQELRARRAVEILEWLGTGSALARLQELAKGTPEARLSREAAAACQRWKTRKTLFP